MFQMALLLWPVILTFSLMGCGSVSETKFLDAKGKAEGGILKVNDGNREYVLIKGAELDYVYKSPDGLDRSIPLHLTQVSIDPAEQGQIFTTALVSSLRNKGFIICQEPCNGRHYAFQVAQTGMHHGSRTWNWISTLAIASPTSTTRIQFEGRLLDPNGKPVFIFADKRASAAYVTKGEDILKSEIPTIADDIASELAAMTRP